MGGEVRCMQDEASTGSSWTAGQHHCTLPLSVVTMSGDAGTAGELQGRDCTRRRIAEPMEGEAIFDRSP